LNTHKGVLKNVGNQTVDCGFHSRKKEKHGSQWPLWTGYHSLKPYSLYSP